MQILSLLYNNKFLVLSHAYLVQISNKNAKGVWSSTSQPISNYPMELLFQIYN